MKRRALLAIVGAAVIGATGFSTSSMAKDFDGLWSVNIRADDESCANQTIPVLVSDGAVSFSGFGANVSGAVSDDGIVRLRISHNEQEVRVNGQLSGSEGSGSWRSAAADCEGSWSAQIAK